MSYRDQLTACMAQIDSLKDDLEKSNHDHQVKEEERAVLRKKLALAEKEMAFLRSKVPGSPEYRSRFFKGALWLFVGLVIATAIAGYHSESMGVTMAYASSPFLGFGLGGLIDRKFGWIGAIGGTLLVPFLIFVFFKGIWPSL